MLARLRWQLTGLYLLAALVLLVLVGGGAYGWLARYFEQNTDLALQNQMAREFRALGQSLPPELRAAETTWYADRPPQHATTSDDEDDEEQDDHPNVADWHASELAAVFVVLLNAEGKPITPSTYTPDAAALASAQAHGHDWRTVWLSNGTRLRLLTYRLEAPAPAALAQVGRGLADQDWVLQQMLTSLLLFGAGSVTLLSVGSWWLAGRTLRPAQQAWERQQTFVANASHELRTPLTLVRASAEFAGRGLPATDERAGLLQDILTECDHMSRLVEDLLLLSRLDAGRLTLERAPLALGPLLAEVQRAVGRVAETRNVQFEVLATPGVVLGDATRVRQVLLIVLDNALRHTPAGGVVQVRAVAKGRFWQVRISDTGPGIAAPHLPRLFERFYRADAARSAKGAGLGLSIAQALIEAQHGHIGVESVEGQGTTVWFTLPAAPQPP